ncbi:MAG: iron ABC transporter substrate-binding protein [Desulfobacterales bacterium]
MKHLSRQSIKTAISAFVLLLLAVAPAPAEGAQDTITIKDAAGRELTVPSSPEHVICSGPGCLRLLTYLEAADHVVAVDSMEKNPPQEADPRPYFLANPELQDLPLFGEFRGRDNPELITALEPRPQIIFKTFANMGHDPVELQKKTGIPVVVLNYGNLGEFRKDLYQALHIMGRIMDKSDRAQQVTGFFDEMIKDLAERTADIPDKEKKTCYVGGIAYKGPHGVDSTQPAYPPFVFTNAKNVAKNPDKSSDTLSNARVAREKILSWNPDVIFMDLSSTAANTGENALDELFSDPAYRHLEAVKKRQIYGVLPYNWYARNFGSIFANAYFVGKNLYPENFSDIDPAQKADHIFTFLVGDAVFDRLDEIFEAKVFDRLNSQE